MKEATRSHSTCLPPRRNIHFSHMCLDYPRALRFYAAVAESRHQDLRTDLVRAAVRYANLRGEWSLLDAAGRRALDEERTRAHDAFITCCNVLSRAMRTSAEDVQWRDELGTDRKVVGDFACFVTLFASLSAR